MKWYIKTQILRYVSGCLLARETYCTKNTLCTAPSPPQGKSDVLETDYINLEDGDFVFAGEEKVPHHKIILSAASPAFKAQGHGAEKHREAIEGKANIKFSPELRQKEEGD